MHTQIWLEELLVRHSHTLKDNVKKHLRQRGCVGLDPIHWIGSNGYLFWSLHVLSVPNE
jgi:hypothetical protein